MGRPKTVSDDYRNRLKELVGHSPREFGYGFRRWSAQWLAKQLEKELGIRISNRYINYLLKDMGLSTRQSRSAPSEPIEPEPGGMFHAEAM